MHEECDRDYHVRRARAELDIAYRTDNRAAMTCHFRLSALHMARMQPMAAAPPYGAAHRVAEPASESGMPVDQREA